jgi:hypothetical protein
MKPINNAIYQTNSNRLVDNGRGLFMLAYRGRPAVIDFSRVEKLICVSSVIGKPGAYPLQNPIKNIIKSPE